MNLKERIKRMLLETYSVEEEEEDENLSLFTTLKKYVRGKVSERNLKNADNSIENIYYSGGLLGKTILTFDLGDDEELFKLLDLSDDDGWFARVITGRHDSYEFMDGYQVEDDFKEGYIVFGDLDDDNKEKLNKISLFLQGKEVNVGVEQQDDMEFAYLLLNTFPDEIDHLLSEWRWAKNDEMTKTAKEDISQQLNEFLDGIGFKISRNFDYISTTSGNLIMWYARTGEKDLNFKELFKKIIEETNTNRLGGWFENSYEFHNHDNFDDSGFNRDASRILDDILEKLEDVNVDIDEFRDKYKVLASKFEVGKWYDLPKNNDYKFQILGFNPETLNIKILAKHEKSWKKKPMELSFDSLHKLLYQPELFSLSELIPESIKEYFDPIHFLKKKFSNKDDRHSPGGLETVYKYGENFQKIVNLIFKKTIKYTPIDNLKGFKVVSIWPQTIMHNSNDIKEVRWNVYLVPVVPDWFNWEKNEKFIQTLIEFDKEFVNTARNMGLLYTLPPGVSDDFNLDKNVEVNNKISFIVKTRKIETF